MVSPFMLLRPGRACGLGPAVWQAKLRPPLSASAPTLPSQLLFFSSSVSPVSRHTPVFRLFPISSSASSQALLQPRILNRLAPLWSIPRRAATTSSRTARLYPERLLIYHAGTPRTTFLACLKVTTIFGLAFFTFLICPSYIAAGKPWGEALGVAACGIIPFALVAYTSNPFVAFVHLRLPPFARHRDRHLLKKFVHSLPPSTTLLDMTTMNLIGRPRVTTVTVGDLVPRKEKLRIVNLVDRRALAVDADSKTNNSKGLLFGLRRSPTFPWVTLPPTTYFGAPAGGNSRTTREGWAWTEVVAGIERRAAEEADREAAKTAAKAKAPTAAPAAAPAAAAPKTGGPAAHPKPTILQQQQRKQPSRLQKNSR